MLRVALFGCCSFDTNLNKMYFSYFSGKVNYLSWVNMSYEVFAQSM